MDRRAFIKTVGLASTYAVVAGAGGCLKAKSDRPNILWIVADDLGTDLGCYGNGLVYTPNIDRLAQEGVRYVNFFTVAAVCSPSRSALITGMYATSINCHNHRVHYKKPLPDPVVPVTHLFREAGYFTCNANSKSTNQPGKEDYNFTAEQIYDGTDWSQRKDGQPFFAQIQIHYPHRPFRPDPDHPIDPSKVEIPPYYPDHWITRADWGLYLESIQWLDREVGKILARLDDEGILENTIVFFFSDQGRCMARAKQFLYDPGIHSPLIVRYPGKRHAGAVETKLVSNIDLAPASLAAAGIEIPDYMQGMNFLDPDARREYIFAARDRCDETVDRIRAVRTDRYKYIRNFYPERPYMQFNTYKTKQYPVVTLMKIMHRKGQLDAVQEEFMAPHKPTEELYDLEKDLYEIHNVAEDPAYADVLKSMRELMDAALAKYDRGTYPEDQREITYARQLASERHKAAWKSRGLGENPTDEQILKWWEGRLQQLLRKDAVPAHQG